MKKIIQSIFIDTAKQPAFLLEDGSVIIPSYTPPRGLTQYLTKEEFEQLDTHPDTKKNAIELYEKAIDYFKSNPSN